MFKTFSTCQSQLMVLILYGNSKRKKKKMICDCSRSKQMDNRDTWGGIYLNTKHKWALQILNFVEN